MSGCPDAIALSVKHELGHLQTLPLALAYASVLAALSGKGSPWIRIPAALISSQAVWEIMAELFTRASLGQFYQTRYAGIKRLPRILFWLLAGLMASGGVILLAIR